MAWIRWCYFYHITNRRQNLEFSDDLTQPLYFIKIYYKQGLRLNTQTSHFSVCCCVCSAPVSLKPGLWNRTTWIQSKVCLLRAAWPWASYLTFLCFSVSSVNRDNTNKQYLLGMVFIGITKHFKQHLVRSWCYIDTSHNFNGYYYFQFPYQEESFLKWEIAEPAWEISLC